MLALLSVCAGGLAAAGLFVFAPDWIVGMLARRSPEVLYFVETSEPVVGLSIDDGPDPATTPELLATLNRHGARATFFLISERVQGREGLVRAIVEGGHEIGNHLTRDEASVFLSPEEFELAVQQADSVLKPFGSLKYLRPASGWYSSRMLATIGASGYRCALGSIYPFDAQIPSSRFAAWYILRHVRPGSIIVVHDGGDRGRRAAQVLQQVLPALRQRGLQVLPLRELRSASGPVTG